jgi:transcriptional regulator with XRE-family HTH domain
MVATTKTEAKSARDVYYYRRRLKNRIFARLAAFFAEEAKRTGLTKKDLAERLNKDPAQITRWLSGPSNLTLDTLSDLLLAMDAEADPPQLVRFSERVTPNYVHPLIAATTGLAPSASATKASTTSAQARLADAEDVQITVTSSGDAALAKSWRNEANLAAPG